MFFKNFQIEIGVGVEVRGAAGVAIVVLHGGSTIEIVLF